MNLAANALGIDTGIAARWSETDALLMPHGGPAVLQALAREIQRLGLRSEDAAHASARFPEARSDLEAEMLAALARAQSPLAVALLLDQPRRWGGAPATEQADVVRASRSDRGRPPWPHEAAVSLQPEAASPIEGEPPGLSELVALLRDRLVPPADLESPAPWRFWG